MSSHDKITSVENYSNSQKSLARALVIGVVLIIISIVGVCAGIKHHDKSTAIFALIPGLVAILGLYSASH